MIYAFLVALTLCEGGDCQSVKWTAYTDQPLYCTMGIYLRELPQRVPLLIGWGYEVDGKPSCEVVK